MFRVPVSPEEVRNIIYEGIANVIPLYKADDHMCFNNYRPVSLS